MVKEKPGFDVTMATNACQAFFQKMENLFLKGRKITFLIATFTFLAQIFVLLLVLITCSGEIQKLKMADPRWPPFGNHYVTAT